MSTDHGICAMQTGAEEAGLLQDAETYGHTSLVCTADQRLGLHYPV